MIVLAAKHDDDEGCLKMHGRSDPRQWLNLRAISMGSSLVGGGG